MLSRTAPGFASRIAVDLFMTPRRHRRPEREIALLREAVPFTVPLGSGASLQAWRWGTSGPVVLLVHGWEGRGSQLAPMVHPLLARGFSVVAFDAPGHGDSSGNRSSLPHFAWAVRSVADFVSDAFAIVAHSLGCAATTLALRDGLSVQRVVFFAPPLDPSDYVDRFGDILNFSPAVLEKMKRRIEERFVRKWTDYALDGIAPHMTAPLLVIHDRGDEETYWSEGAAVAAAWPSARLLTTEGLGHRRILREPHVVEAATAFLAG